MCETTPLRTCLAGALLLLVIGYTARANKVIYVDDDASGVYNGTSWTDAYKYLQDALADAITSDKPIKICVAQGVYKPNDGVENRIIRFQLINNVVLSGGYAGLTEPDPNERDVDKYETILSGDLNGDDVDIDSPIDLHDEPTRSDNCSSIVIGSYTDHTAVLDGFTITGGRARRRPAAIDRPTGGGGGMKNEHGSPTIRNCLFVGNSAEVIGGAVHNMNSNPTFINCTFTNNYAYHGAGRAAPSAYQNKMLVWT